MSIPQILSAILLGPLLVSGLHAQSEIEAADPILETYHCGDVYEWALWVDVDGDGQREYKLSRDCYRILDAWYEGESAWDQVMNWRELVEVGNAFPTLLKEVSDSGTVWYVEERDTVSGEVVCRSTLIDGYVRTDCKQRPIGTQCYFPESIRSVDGSEAKKEER